MKSTLIAVAIPLACVIVAYYRFRDQFFDLAWAAESKRSDIFWVTLAVIFSAILASLYFAIRGYFRFHSYR
jgi:hypothetical protein